jgi:hypothetical protein
MLVQTEIGCIGDPVVAADADAKLARLYAAIEEGVVDAADPNLKGRLAELRRVRDAASEDVKRAEARGGPAPAALTSDLVKRFGAEARKSFGTGKAGSAATTSRRWFSASRWPTRRFAFADRPNVYCRPSQARS